MVIVASQRFVFRLTLLGIRPNRNSVMGDEQGPIHVIHQVDVLDESDHTIPGFFQRDHAFRVRKPTVFVKNRLHQGCRKVETHVEHTVVPGRIIIAIGRVSTIVKRHASISCTAHML